MLDDFIYAFITTILGEQQKVIDSFRIKEEILDCLVKSDDDFHVVELNFEEFTWLLPVQPVSGNMLIKSIQVQEFI